MTVIDAHQHFWELGRGDYRFPRPGDPVLYRDFLPDRLAPLLRSSGVDQTILVQATDSFVETEFLLHLAATTPFVAGVVGWWDPRAPDGLAQIERLAEDGPLVGVRPMLQGVDDISFILAPDSLADLHRMAGRGLVLDALIDPSQLRTIAELCRSVPSLKIVVDHMAKPWRMPGQLESWAAGMRELAAHRNCAVKVSGFPFASPGAQAETVEALVTVLRETFGIDRLLWGSDWPVAEREGGYSMVLNRMQALFSVGERHEVFGCNAETIYGLPRQEASLTK